MCYEEVNLVTELNRLTHNLIPCYCVSYSCISIKWYLDSFPRELVSHSRQRYFKDKTDPKMLQIGGLPPERCSLAFTFVKILLSWRKLIIKQHLSGVLLYSHAIVVLVLVYKYQNVNLLGDSWKLWKFLGFASPYMDRPQE